MNILSPIKKQTSGFVNIREQNKLVSVVNRLRKTTYCPSQFITQDRPDGQYVSLRRDVSADEYWSKALFGYVLDGNTITVLYGEVHFRDLIYTCAETDVTISVDDTYVYLQMEWGTGLCSILSTQSLGTATTTSQYFRKWLYKMSYSNGSTDIKLFGHPGGSISIMPVFG